LHMPTASIVEFSAPTRADTLGELILGVQCGSQCMWYTCGSATQRLCCCDQSVLPVHHERFRNLHVVQGTAHRRGQHQGALVQTLHLHLHSATIPHCHICVHTAAATLFIWQRYHPIHFIKKPAVSATTPMSLLKSPLSINKNQASTSVLNLPSSSPVVIRKLQRQLNFHLSCINAACGEALQSSALDPGE
jgi:hypothetical protein